MTSSQSPPTSTPIPDAKDDQEAQCLLIPLRSRAIGYATYGPAAGRPLFFFHGLPGSRYDARYITPILDKLNIRVISIDRPGYGLSSFDGQRTILDWPVDVLTLADHLNIDTFRVIGLSGGGPYALACAYGIPKTRLVATGVWEGIAPVQRIGVGKMGFGWYGMISWWATIHLRTAWHFIAKFMFRRLLKSPRENTEERMRIHIGKMKEGPQKEFYMENMDTITTSMHEGFKQGIEGYLYDADIIRDDWEFGLEDIPNREGGCGDVKLFYGSKDTLTPLASAKWMVQKMGGKEVVGKYGDATRDEDGEEPQRRIQLRVYEGETHETLMRREFAEDVLRDLFRL